ncbi:MAG: cytochrome c3 family protein, partial [candidate division Zixibacteria bacterium]
MRTLLSRSIAFPLVLYLIIPVGTRSNGISADEPTTFVSSHENSACNECHQLASGSTDPSPNSACTTCHISVRLKSGQFSDPFHLDTSLPCVRCHEFHKMERLTVDGETFTPPAEDRDRYVCRTCHNSLGSADLLSEGHWMARILYHSDTLAEIASSPSQSCLSCHSKHGGSVGRSRSAIPIKPGASHKVGVLAAYSGSKGTQTIDPLIPLFNDRVEC